MPDLREDAPRADVPASHVVFQDYFRCPDRFARIRAGDALSPKPGYFGFHGAVCYGRAAIDEPLSGSVSSMPDLSDRISTVPDGIRLPFSLSEVVTNLRLEQYEQEGHGAGLLTSPLVSALYYRLRPMLGVTVRKRLQRIAFRGWERIPFPSWPVDVTVDTLMERVMALLLKELGVPRIPFVWFWPDGADCAAIVTHDVEGRAGRAFCRSVMDLDERHGIASAFQLVPEDFDGFPATLAREMRTRGFEVNLHDLNHDGNLYRDSVEFVARAARIREHARRLGCEGFRSAVMYRRQEWHDALGVSYDMSVPNVAHLEPQRGGCCTVMPYFVGQVLELPLTTAQDYTLFHILEDYSTSLWQRQIEAIAERHGLITLLTHPDYLVDARARAVYGSLLETVCSMRDSRGLWVALPAEVNRWWRSRQAMTLVQEGGAWRVRGPDSCRARVAYATLEGERVVYAVERAT